jgi:hypothetical protein
VEDKGDKDDPHHATRNQVGHPVPAGHVSYRRRRWEPGKLHSELREKKEQRPGRNSPSFDAATGRRTNRGSVSPAYGYVLLVLVKHSNEGGPGTQEIIGEGDSGPIRTTQQVLVYLLPFPKKQVMRITWLYPQAIRASQARPPPAPFKYILHPLQRCQ